MVEFLSLSLWPDSVSDRGVVLLLLERNEICGGFAVDGLVAERVATLLTR